MKMKTAAVHVIVIFALVLLAGCLFIPDDTPWPTDVRTRLVSDGEKDTGAKNLVSAIYLAYRAFDTLGETIVLIVAIIGTMSVVESVKKISDDPTTAVTYDFSLVKEKRSSHKLRTHLLEVVTGKIGPVVLLFGFYVMGQGHISPGGGFQGGTIIASGIMLFILGNPYSKVTEMRQNKILSTIEASAFVLFILVSLLSILTSGIFFSNPLEAAGVKYEYYIIALNALIGLKVGSGISLMCIAMMSRRRT
ncbi:MAG: MnhB domain-containing protein [Sphaerochaetaceae bacterium]|nr:MnhB domain-containing protein [Sphaerochaetaceae bacterium]